MDEALSNEISLSIKKHIKQLKAGYQTLTKKLKQDFNTINGVSNSGDYGKIEQLISEHHVEKILEKQRERSEELEKVLSEFSKRFGKEKVTLTELVEMVNEKNRKELTLHINELLTEEQEARKQLKMNLELTAIIRDIKSETLNAVFETAKKTESGNRPLILEEEF